MTLADTKPPIILTPEQRAEIHRKWAEAAETVEEDIRKMKESTRITHEMLRWEITI